MQDRSGLHAAARKPACGSQVDLPHRVVRGGDCLSVGDQGVKRGIYLVVPMSLGALGPYLLLTAAAASSDRFDESRVATLVWENAPDVLAARAQSIDADAVRDRSYLLPNPVVGVGWATIPIGKRTDDAAFWDVPNYSVGVSTLIELGKRGPRQAAAEAAKRSAGFASRDVYRRAFFDVLETLSNQAAATIRAAVLRRLVSSSEESLRLQRARAERGDVAALEVDRLRVEHLRLRSALGETEAEQQLAILACVRVLGLECPRLSDEDEATAFLRRVSVPETETAVTIRERPDLQARGAEALRLRAESVLASRLKDPRSDFRGVLHARPVRDCRQSGKQRCSDRISAAAALRPRPGGGRAGGTAPRRERKNDRSSIGRRPTRGRDRAPAPRRLAGTCAHPRG